MTDRSAGCVHEGRPRLPSWLKRPLAYQGRHNEVQACIDSGSLHTVCAEAKCPNRSECFNRGTAAFLILGNHCTRNCTYCSINHGAPLEVDPMEPRRVAEACALMKLRHVVVTSVTRDDLPDGGASHFAAVIRSLREKLPGATVEVLVPDFRGDNKALTAVFDADPDVFNHNIETVPRLYPQVRPMANYSLSLSVLRDASGALVKGVTKSGLMVGLGETEREVHEVMNDLAEARCSIVTIGQYLQPSTDQTSVVRFVEPEEFARYKEYGKELGFSHVAAGPFVRSSYRADEAVRVC